MVGPKNLTPAAGSDVVLKKTRKQPDPGPITVGVFGGLGNQLFQYAMGRALALRTGRNLELDIRFFDSKRPFKYELDNFHVQASVGTQESLPPYKNKRFSYLYWRYFASRNRFIREGVTDPFEKELPEGGSVYLHGYWQSPTNFSDAAEVIRKDLSPISVGNQENIDLLEKISRCESVAIHIRRGDYLTSKKAKQIYANCSIPYYLRALEKFRSESQSEITAFIFSDDPDWASENLKTCCSSEVVSINGPESPHRDLCLMARCKHQIIANSTFSWWAAWLNNNPRKMVSAPKWWLKNRKSTDARLIPEGWSVIEN